MMCKKVIYIMFILLFSVSVYGASDTYWVTITGPMFAADSLNGVHALYTNEYNSKSDAEYSCAAYVKKYYDAVYGVSVYNLMDEGPPLLYEKEARLVQVFNPQTGDIVFWPVTEAAGNHSAIVKRVEENSIVLIEQNYKYSGQAAVERRIDFPGDGYQLWRLTGANHQNSIRLDQSFTERTAAPLLQGQWVIVTGTKESPQFFPQADASASSYYLNNGLTYTFHISESHVMCSYLDNDGFWQNAAQNETFETKEAYISILKNPADGLGEYEAPGIPDENPVIQAPAPLFIDVPDGHWAFSAISVCAQKGYLSGYPDGSFLPSAPITRGELAKIITEYMQISTNGNEPGIFSDVGLYSWYRPYIYYGKDYLPGYDRGGLWFYEPDKPVLREDLCVALANMFALKLDDTDYGVLEPFADSAHITEEKMVYVAQAVQAGFISGTGDGTLSPQEPVTRAQIAYILATI